MTSKKSLISLILLFPFWNLFAGTVTIHGTAYDYKGKEIMVFNYLDQFTRLSNIIDIQRVDSTAAFTFSFEIEQTQQILLRCDYVNAHLYVEPGGNYDIIFPELPSGQVRSINNTAFVDITFNALPKGDINSKILAFNREYTDFFTENRDLLMHIIRPGSGLPNEDSLTQKKRPMVLYTEKINKFSEQMDSTFNNPAHDFFYIYRKSVEADLYQNTYTTPRKIFETYIQPYPIDIQNPEQTILLSSFYDNYLTVIEDKQGKGVIAKALSSETPLPDILSVFEKDDFLNNKERREIVLLFCMLDNLNNKDYNKAIILGIIENLAQNGSTSSTKTLAKNTLHTLRKDSPGEKAYDFNLVDINGERHHLTDYKGKYIVLEFWASWCKDCKKELFLTSGFADNYKKDFEFISISIDQDVLDMKEYLADHKELNQVFLHQDNEKLLLDEYNIWSLPAYFIIDRDSKILVSHAPKPSLVLESKLHAIRIQEEEKNIDNFDPKDRIKH